MGGQLELRALAAALHCIIVVYSANAAPLRMGEDNSEPRATLHVSYHIKALALGEHYNSCVPVTLPEEEEEEEEKEKEKEGAEEEAKENEEGAAPATSAAKE